MREVVQNEILKKIKMAERTNNNFFFFLLDKATIFFSKNKIFQTSNISEFQREKSKKHDSKKKPKADQSSAIFKIFPSLLLLSIKLLKKKKKGSKQTSSIQQTKNKQRLKKHSKRNKRFCLFADARSIKKKSILLSSSLSN